MKLLLDTHIWIWGVQEPWKLSSEVARAITQPDNVLFLSPLSTWELCMLTKRKRVWLRDLRNIPFTWFPRWANPSFYDQMMQACSLGGLSAPRIVQEAADRDTNLSLAQCRIGVSWHNESVRWHCPRGIVLLPVVDMNVRLPFSLIWKKDNSSPLLQKFVAQVKAGKIT